MSPYASSRFVSIFPVVLEVNERCEKIDGIKNAVLFLLLTSQNTLHNVVGSLHGLVSGHAGSLALCVGAEEGVCKVSIRSSGWGREGHSVGRFTDRCGPPPICRSNVRPKNAVLLF